jgi:murein L,D-transpeptidase YcbB/YkuD
MWNRRRLLAVWSLAAASGIASADDRLRWFDGGRPRAIAYEAVALLADAPSHGLNPGDYAAGPLARELAQASTALPPDPAAAARLDVVLDAAMTRFLADLHDGRIDPRTLGQAYAAPRREPFDAAASLRRAMATGRLADAVREAAPPLAQYERLREALAQHRRLVGHAAWAEPLPALPARRNGGPARLEPGQDWAGLARLGQRLRALGDLPADDDATTYDGPRVAALQSFQRRHGLEPDGVIGRSTLAALEIPPAVRVRQLELALERLRWTPLRERERMVVINLPEFVLRAYEVRGERLEVAASMRVIVGKALDTRTPIFDADMRFVEFRPFWNVPPSIARAEVVPRLRRDPGWFDREGFEFVGADGQVSRALTPARIDALAAGALRIRQRPGPRNALGDIKFVFPNAEHIFLHHTPETHLFARGRRDFSHGCVRVEDPVALARFVLRDRPEWIEARIRAAMTLDPPTTLRLDPPVRVLIAYGTALVKDGRAHFFADLYRQDRRLDEALSRLSASRPPLLP